jgi:serine/threonine-protein kinase RIM15
MLQRKFQNRLGINGIHEVKDHPWFKNFNFKALYERKLESPFVPKLGDNFDKKYCEGLDKIGNDTLERYQKYYSHEEYSNLFRNYTYISNIPEDFNTTKRDPKTDSPRKYSSSILKGKIKISDIKNSNNSNISSRSNSGNVNKISAININKFSNNILNREKSTSKLVNSSISSTNKSNISKDKNIYYKVTPIINKSPSSLIINSQNLLKSFNKMNDSKQQDKLPSIDINKSSTRKKMSHSPSLNLFYKFSKNSSISVNSTGSSSNSFYNLHKRSGSTNNFK